MKNLMIAGALVALTACSAASRTPPVPPAQVEACWKQAGIQGDLYKFIQPSIQGKLTSAPGASQAQLDSFNSCVGQ